ncbi:DUF4129 domain-containing protein [Nocardioides bizhenqiangii]|uniref:DUF4129 domain-containing protein n=1 Tax=Nocardioides bizhenqiangii TaxID=3095076 RepID=A0ABZ0ZT15_9ACTN|nr:MULTISPECIES: DUF4129 domain-containing protein [unclassified Nocardioides]MDZ5621890.1 DUF4129 domain-containing protein [Nocardioides sp. HM23]WQQ27427.1 DUF4129 domain-containing protein [Nocardioides sp. HM61]
MIPLDPAVPVRLADPPLDPSADEARSLLRQELANPEYHDTNLVERIQNWLGRLFDDSVGAAADIPPLGTFAAIVILLLIVVAIGLLVSRARRTARARGDRAPALTDEVVTAAALRQRAEAALAEGRYDDALVDAYRALAVRQVERGRIEDLPQATAHELAAGLGVEFPAQRHLVDRSADLFDAVLYGDHPASREQALDVLALDDELAGRRERVR